MDPIRSLRVSMAVVLGVTFAAVIPLMAATRLQQEDVAATCVTTGVSTQSDPNRVARVSSMLDSLKLMNYYPAEHAFTQLWKSWDPSEIDADFATIAGLHANAVRVIVHMGEFGYPRPAPTMLDRLAQVVDLADRHGLRVEVTLFDWGADHRDIAGSEAWARDVLSRYRDDPRVAFVELQNEIDTRDSMAIAWATSVTPCVQAILDQVPVSLSVSGVESVDGLQRLVAASVPVDFLDLHYYGKPALALATFESAKQVVGTTPLFIGETGYSTIRSFDSVSQRWLELPAQEAFQDKYDRTVFAAAQAASLPSPAPWIFSDLQPWPVPPESDPPDPGQLQYGLYRTDGSAKPSVGSIRDLFGANTVDLSFNNSFEQADASGLPLDWDVWNAPQATFTRDTTVSHSGTASVEISEGIQSPTASPSFFAAPVAPIRPNQRYAASVWARGVNTTGMTAIAIAWFSADSRFLGSDYSAGLPSEMTDWTQLSVTAAAPPEAASAEIHLVSARNRGQAWFDDVSFEESD